MTSNPPTELQRAVVDFTQRIDAQNCIMSKLVAERFTGDESPTTRYSHDLGFSLEQSTLFYQHEVTATMMASDDDTTVAVITAVALLSLHYADESQPPTPPEIDFLAATSVPLITTPFLREAIYSTATRLGIVGVFLPLSVARLDLTDLLSAPSPQ